MIKNILLAIFVLLIPFSVLSLDDIGGDYLISGIRKVISLDLEGAKLVDVLKMLSQQTGLNFTSSESVKERSLTLYLEKVPLKEALDIIFKTNNLTYDYYPEANIFVVKEMGKPTIELKTKVYRLQYIPVRSARATKEINASLAPAGASSTGAGDDGITATVKKVLTEFGKITEDPITNSLIVVDVPAQFPVIDQVIKELDIPKPKVMIEVEMLDVSKKTMDKLGILFKNGLYGSFTPGKMNVVAPFPKSFLGDINWTAVPTRELTLSIFDLTSFTAVLQFLSQEKSTKHLARPKILTLSNETAEIKITTNEAIGVSKTTDEKGETTYTIERAETGTKLRVTPQVEESTGEITLFVEAVVKEAKDSGFVTQDQNFVSGTIKNPEERGTKAVLRLNNGETLLIGGLIKNTASTTITKIPVLGDIPFLGALFRFKERPIEDNEDRELLVFLTPKILEDQHILMAKESGMPREQESVRRNSIGMVLDRFDEE
jgi:type IV pilus assembly protein PilQ